ncbi:hypothetical protein CONLIGDRAFT_60905 [Coniochaeta ligniaria NRRL 30616]|uniref:Uncharacterized protein n=1 Tax=Coniochaeta ligniaria NRRL 30616 TaxID=1408157 RepID=A0A1J7K1A3_9PEZI|nr:hypothetical protein CONLIGDRAFT_60905 [Coniochaeta ligniaria NRRL 30616]
MKRLFKSWAGRKSPSPRKTRPSRRRHTSRRVDYLPDGTLQPVYSAMQTAAPYTTQTTAGEQDHDDVGVSNDKLVDSQHFCFKCGKARSKRYHMDNPVKPGSTPPASCCSKCRKNTSSEPSLKYLQHFCVDCGRVRSRFYHKEHPVRAGHKPRPSYCHQCRTRREEETRGEGDWEDIDAVESSSRFVATQDGLIVPSDSTEDEFDHFSGRSSYRRAPNESAKLSVPATSSRKVSRESVQSARSFQPSVEEAPPTPPSTPSPIIPIQQPAAQKNSLEKKVAFEVSEKEAPDSSAQTTAPGTGTASDGALVVSPKREDCNHVHVVCIHPPCYHHGHGDHCQSSQNALAKAHSSRGRRSDSNTTTTTSSKQSRRVAFATPEVSSRHEADADYDRTAVPENHEDPFDFGLDTGPSRGNYHARGFNPDGRRRRSPTPGPTPRDFGSSSGRSSSEYGSSSSGYGHSRMDAHSPPPPEYSGPPPKVLTPDEIRALWDQGPQLEHPRRRQAQEAERRNNGPPPSRDFSSHNREGSATNQRSFSEGNYPSGFDNRSQQSSSSGYGNPGAPDYRASDNRRASDGRYRNDENIDPKTRYNSSGTSRPSQSRGRDGSSQQSANMYNTNRSNEYSNTRQNESRGPRPSENPNMYNNQRSASNASSNYRPSESRGQRSENNPNMYNNQTASSNSRASESRGQRSENNPNMYNNQTNASSNHRPSQSRTSSSQSETNSNMYNNNNQPNNHHNPRPSSSSQSDRPHYQNNASQRDSSRHSSTTAPPPAQEPPFTARERMWTDGPEQARKLREAMERLERAAAASSTKTAKSPPTPDIGASDSSSPAFDTDPSPNVSTPDFGSTMPDFGSSNRASTPDARNFSSATFGSDKRDFASSTFGSDKREFSSSTRRNFSSSTTGRRDFSPNVPQDFVPPRPSAHFHPRRTASASTWEHPCGPFCNDFCPDRADHVAREIVEVDSEEEKEILAGGKGGKGSTSRKSSSETIRKVSTGTGALALVRRRPRRSAFVAVAEGGAPSPGGDGGSDYYTASESSR